MAIRKNIAQDEEPTNVTNLDVNDANSKEASTSTTELGQLQEILFGRQQRSTDQAISTVQEDLNDQLQTLSNVLGSRLNQLAETADKSSKQFETRLNELQATQQQSIDSLGERLNTAVQEMKKEMSSISNSSQEEKQLLQAEMSKTESSLLGEIKKTKDGLSSQVNLSIDKLRSDKLDRADFAGILGDMSVQLGKART